jgi:hypothetical protein
MSKAPREETGFRNPPLWIHVSEAFLAPREARKRAVIRLIDKVKTGVGAQPRKRGSDPNLA